MSDKANIRLKGFLYKKEDGMWVLAKQPNIKSCCIGKIDPGKNQVYVEGNFEELSPNKAVTLEGKLERCGNGYILKEASFAKEANFPYLSLGFIVVVFLTYCLLKKRTSVRG